MIAILGATGKIGGAAAAELRHRGLPVRAVLRDGGKGQRLAQMGCEIAIADLGDEEALGRALVGVEKLLMICPLPPTLDDVLGRAERLIDGIARAIAAARPRAVVAISDYGAQHATGTGITVVFHRLEERLRTIPTALTFLRSAEHMQNGRRYLASARQQGVLPSLHHPLDKLYPTVSAPDVGLLAAKILSGDADDRQSGPRVIHVEGPRRYAALDLARVLGEVVGRPVVAQALPRESWADTLVAAGLSPSYAQLVCELQDAHNAGGIDVEAGGEVWRGTTDLLTALSSPPVPPGVSHR